MYMHVSYVHIICTAEFSDIDECSAKTDNCADVAKCFNAFGGYDCACNDGYSGNGVTCNGKPNTIKQKSYNYFN